MKAIIKLIKTKEIKRDLKYKQEKKSKNKKIRTLHGSENVSILKINIKSLS